MYCSNIIVLKLYIYYLKIKQTFCTLESLCCLLFTFLGVACACDLEAVELTNSSSSS